MSAEDKQSLYNLYDYMARNNKTLKPLPKCIHCGTEEGDFKSRGVCVECAKKIAIKNAIKHRRYKLSAKDRVDIAQGV